MSKNYKTIIMLIFLTLFVFTSCGKKNSAQPEEKSIICLQDEYGTIFLDRELETGSYSGMIESMCRAGDKIYFFCNDYDRKTETASNHLYIMPLAGGEVKEIDYGDKSASVCSLSFDGENVYLLTVLADYEAEIFTHSLIKINIETDTCTEDTIEANKDSGPNSVFFDSKGHRYYVYNDEILVYKDGSELFALKAEDSENFAFCLGNEAGDTMALSQKDMTYTVRKIDIEAKGFGTERADFGLKSYNHNSTFTSGTGPFDFYYIKEGAVYGYSMTDGSEKQILNYLLSDISDLWVDGQFFIDDSKVIINMHGYDGGIKLYTRAESSEIKDKTVLTVVSTSNSGDIEDLISEFNSHSRDYKAVLKEYDQDPQTGASRFSLDTATGEPADIYIVGNTLGNISVAKCISLGLFEDLTSYYEKDSEVNKDDIIPNIYDALQYDGKIYFTVGNAEIKTIAASKELAGDIDGWTIEELKQFAEVNGGGSKLMDVSGKRMFDRMIISVQEDYIDRNNKKCSFNSEEFITLLNFFKESKRDDDEFDYANYAQMIQDGEILCMMEDVSEPSWLVLMETLYNGEAVFPGLPSKDRHGNIFVFENRMAMASGSKNKDGAWEFMKYMMTRRYQGIRYAYEFGIPVRKDIFELYMERITATEDYVDEFGNEIYPYRMGTGFNGFNLDVGPLTAEQAEKFRKLIENTVKVVDYDYEVYNIIIEEADAFFMNAKSAEEVAEIINNRVETYINENT